MYEFNHNILYDSSFHSVAIVSLVPRLSGVTQCALINTRQPWCVYEVWVGVDFIQRYIADQMCTNFRWAYMLRMPLWAL